MENALDTAFSFLPSLSRDELRQLQSRISELLQEPESSGDFFPPLPAKELERQLDEAIAEFDAGKGYSAEKMCRSVRDRFGWTRT